MQLYGQHFQPRPGESLDQPRRRFFQHLGDWLASGYLALADPLVLTITLQDSPVPGMKRFVADLPGTEQQPITAAQMQEQEWR